MAKKTKKYDKKGPVEKSGTKDDSAVLGEKAALEKLPKEVQEKLKNIKKNQILQTKYQQWFVKN